MAKRNKQAKKNSEHQDDQSKQSEKKVDLSGTFVDTVKDALTIFSKISESERNSLYGNQAFLDQFRECFKINNPGVLDGIKKEDMPRYLAILEKKGFTIHTLSNRADKLHAEFSPDKPEREVMQDTLKNFDRYCKDSINDIPSGTFKKFADAAGFDHESYNIPRGSNLQTVDSLYSLWKSFAEKEHIVIKPNQHINIESILCPEYNPVERIMVEVAIAKLRKEIPNTLHEDFDERFALPLTAFSALGNLRVFKQQWLMFLDEHARQIDKKLAKKLDDVIVTNGDIRKILLASGKKFDSTKGFENQERYFLRVFNHLATRQLFEEVKDTEEVVDKYIDVVGQTVKGFPPYVNEIFRRYPFHNDLVAQAEPTLTAQVDNINAQITVIEKNIVDDKISQEERNRLLKQREEFIQQRETAKWNAYAKYLASKDKALATVVAKLVGARFDFAKLSVQDQQVILSFLVKDKLSDLIARKAPELLGIDANGLKQFTENLFDLSKKDLLLPTREGPVHIVFREKKFLSQHVDHFLSVTDLGSLNNLPLQFVVEPTPSSQEFFERGVLRGHDGGKLFDTFQSKNNGPVVLNDGYKVKLTKDGKTVQGYLSQANPIDEEDDSDSPKKQTRWHLYSEPVTDIHFDRKRVTWDGKDQGIPVSIDEQDEKDCTLEVMDKSFDLNGEAIGSLLFAYVLGQQSQVQNMSVEKENELARKIGKLERFMDTQDRRPSLADDQHLSAPVATATEKKENVEYNKFLEEWKHLDGYTFPEDTQNFGFVKGTKLFIETGETALPPDTTGGSTWMHLEIVDINTKKGTFKVKMHGGEFSLGGNERGIKEIPMNGSSIGKIKEILGKTIYKVPVNSSTDPLHLLDGLKKSGFDKLYQDNFACTFDTIRWDGGKYTFATGDFIDQDVVSFGQDVNDYEFDGSRTIAKPKHIRYQVKYLPNGRVKISHEFNDQDEKSWTRDREMDYAEFILFVTSKKLEPQPLPEVKKSKDISTADDSPDLEPKKKKRPYNINNIASFFKTVTGKLKDGIKKYDEERAEELTDLVLQNGERMEKFGKMRGGLSSRIGEGFETAGLEYYTTRDSRIWKKIEKWQQYYEKDPNYAAFFTGKLKLMLDGKEKPKDIYKLPAMLLTIISKEKDPYARSPQLIGTGHRVNLLLGKTIQQKFLDLLNQKKEEMRQGAAISGSNWAVMKNEEIIKLEMQYIVAVIDGREHSISGDVEKAMAAKWSRAFAGKLSDAAKTVGFGETDKKANEIPMSTTFEYAEFEYSRNVKNNKSGSALPNLKAMAKLAQTERQREVFQMHITSGVLSGFFWRTLDAPSKGWIKDICRTRGFIPGLWTKDINQQNKLQKLIDIFSNGSFSKGFEYKDAKGNKKTGYSPDNYTFGNMDSFGLFVHEDFKKRWFKNENGHKFCKFLEMTGGNASDKKLMDLAADTDMPNDQRAILQEYMRMGQETAEDIDKNVQGNPSALKGTPFTKCETMVKEMMKYDGSDFAGTSSNEKAGPARFWKNVTQGLPTNENQSTASIEFFMRKFMNRFGHCGFEGGQQPTIFLKRLTTIREMYRLGRSREAEDMLWYTINGTIIQGNSAGRETPPKEFLDALEMFKQFFKNNLDRILSPSVITNTLGERYARDDEASQPYEIGDRKEYIEIVQSPAMDLGPGSKERASIRKKYKLMEYEIYSQLYKTADSLEDRHGMRNEFKKYYSKKSAMPEAIPVSPTHNVRNAKGIVITNPQNIKDDTKQNIKQTLNDTGADPDEQEDLFAAMMKNMQ